MKLNDIEQLTNEEIEKIYEKCLEYANRIKNGDKYQVLLGATGTGKTFTIANVIKEINKPTLVLAHNKTLAGQLYSEFKELFPNDHVCYFVSYYRNTLKNLLFQPF